MIDSHSHYDDDRFSGDCEQILNDLKNHKIDKIINIGCDVETSKKAIALAEKFDFAYASVGFHPNYVFSMTDSDISELIALSKNEKVVAWGEIGLDFHYEYSEKDVQISAFKTQLDVAKTLDLPVIIHSREATEELMKMMRDYKHKGVFHCYSGSLETAKEIIKMGYYISFSGTVTYKNAKTVKEVAKWIPNDRYLIETDCPYLSPEPKRGTRNDSRNLIHTASYIADLRGISLEQLELETMNNTKSLFNID
jgi:TatD DNase family protein